MRPVRQSVFRVSYRNLAKEYSTTLRLPIHQQSAARRTSPPTECLELSGLSGLVPECPLRAEAREMASLRAQCSQCEKSQPCLNHRIWTRKLECLERMRLWLGAEGVSIEIARAKGTRSEHLESLHGDEGCDRCLSYFCERTGERRREVKSMDETDKAAQPLPPRVASSHELPLWDSILNARLDRTPLDGTTGEHATTGDASCNPLGNSMLSTSRCIICVRIHELGSRFVVSHPLTEQLIFLHHRVQVYRNLRE